MLGAFQKRLHHVLASGFGAWGRIVARRPLKIFVVSLIFFLFLCAGVIRLAPENRSQYLWVPTDSKSYLDWRYVENRFGVQGHNLVLYARAKPGKSIFDFDAVEQLLAAHKFTVELQTIKPNGEVIKFTDACKRLAEYDDEDYKSDKKCYTPSFLSLWNYERNTLLGADESILSKINALHRQVSIESFAGNVAFEERADGTRKVKGAEAVAIFFPLASDSGPSYDIQPAWNDGIAGAVDSDVIDVFHFSERSFDDEVARLVNDDIPLFAAGMTIITFFVACTLGPLTSLFRSRVLLGVMAIINVLLSVGGGFGIASVIGVRFPSIAALLPLIVLGVQVDSLIILVDNLDAEPEGDALEDRIGNSLSKSGPAVLVTALTTICAFATSTTTTLPAIAMFASFGALSFSVALVVIFTFFLSVLVLDEQRLIARRISFAPCLRASGAAPAAAASPPASSSFTPSAHDQNEGGIPKAPAPKRLRSNKASEIPRVGKLQRFVRDYYAPFLLSPPVSALIVLAFILLATLSALSIPRIQVGLPNEDVLPDDSYVINALRVQDTSFGGQISAPAIVLRGQDYENPETRASYRRLRRAVSELDFVKAVPPDWLGTYEKWRAAKKIESEDGEFLDRLHDFLNEIGFTAFQDSVVCDRENSCRHPSDTRFNVVFPLGTGLQIEMIGLRERLDAELRKQGFEDDFTFDINFLFAESDVVIWYLTYTNMIFAVVAIFGVMLLFNPPPIAIWITVCVALIDVDLLGVIWAVGLKLNAVTYVTLVMAIGLSVDYCVHIAHAFSDAHHGAIDDAPPGEPISTKDSAIYALTTMGASVIKGGFTTILGVLVIAFASSVAFRTFFTMISFTVLLGLMHGMVLLPILLTYATALPRSCSKGAVGAPDAELSAVA